MKYLGIGHPEAYGNVSSKDVFKRFDSLERRLDRIDERLDGLDPTAGPQRDR